MLDNILLIGCGRMGGALVRGWLARGTTDILIVDPGAPSILPAPSVRHVSDVREAPPDYRPSAVVLAVKPQQMAAVLPAYAQYRQAVFLSIAAGQTLARLQALLGQAGHAVVRAMPNLPASIGAGISVAVAGQGVSPAQRALCEALLGAVGGVGWVEDEGLIDAVTALSGSGPAYVFALAEAMEAAGEALGLPPELAARLARQTVIGSGALLAESGQDAAALRQAVTSPGGTTAAALEVLLAQSNGLSSVLLCAMRAAAARARALSD